MKIEPRVLIVEDEGRMRDLLLRAVKSWGLEAAGAHSGEEGIRLLAAQTYHIVLLDLNLPAMSGMEVFERIRNQWPQTEVIILTGFGDLTAAKQAVHLDAVEFLTKPCHLGELERAIDRARRRLGEAEPAVQEESPVLSIQTESPTTLDELERQHILAALSRHEGNRVATAAELGISLRTLYYRLSEYQKQGFSIG